jgi:hypothetical protein
MKSIGFNRPTVHNRTDRHSPATVPRSSLEMSANFLGSLDRSLGGLFVVAMLSDGFRQ